MQTGRTTSSSRSSRVICLAPLIATAHCAAGSVDVTLLDRDDAPIGGVAVYAVPLDASRAGPEAASPPGVPAAVMDQADSAFVPHLLVVESGTGVAFPNNDTVSHHVYSFSAAKTFELPLYKGDRHAPVQFDTPGVVVLGCNIHDDMLGYIVVVDTPHFAVTDAAGNARLPTLPDGDYAVHVFTPRARPDALPEPATITVDGTSTHALTIELDARLMPAHDSHGGTSLTWDPY